MKNLQQLKEQLYLLQNEEPTGFAHALRRKSEIEVVEKEIAYYERGEFISIEHIQQKIVEIKELEEKIESCKRQLTVKKSDLKNYIFGDATFNL